MMLSHQDGLPSPLRFCAGREVGVLQCRLLRPGRNYSQVTGKAWGDYLNERLFLPLDMNATRPTSMTELGNTARTAMSGAWASCKTRASLRLAPSGAFLSSVLDLAKWDAALYTTKSSSNHPRADVDAVKLTTARPTPTLRWELAPVGSHKLVSHGGSLPGFRAGLARFVDDQLTVVVLTNSDNVNPRSLAVGIATLYLPGLIP